MKTSNSLFAAAGFTAIVELIIWASVARESVSTQSLFDKSTNQNINVTTSGETARGQTEIKMLRLN